MYPVHSVDEIRAAEAELISKLPPNELMHRAAFGMHVEIAEILKLNFGRVSGTIGIGLIGSGNNGSDALWSLALLAQRGVRVFAVKVVERKPDHTDAIFQAAGGTWISLADATARAHQFNFWLDGIAGLSCNRGIAGEWQQLVESFPNPTLGIAVDVPSGVSVDRGEVFDQHVAADYTITFGVLKVALVKSPAADVAGEIRLVDIGLDLGPSRLRFFTDSDSDSVDVIPNSNSHKYNRGVVAVIAGSKDYPGAGQLASRAALYGCAGTVMHFAQTSILDPLAASVLRMPLADFATAEKLSAIVFGPGLTESELQSAPAVLQSEIPVVLDAGAIQYCFKHHRDLIEKRKTSGLLTVLTPHAGELTQLEELLHLKLPDLAKETGCVVYRKGSRAEIYTPSGEVGFVRKASAFLATAGSGDVLAGLLGSLIAQNPTANPIELVAAAVLRHTLLAEELLRQDEMVTADALTHVLVHKQ